MFSSVIDAQGLSQSHFDDSNQDLRIREEQRRHREQVRRNTIAAGMTVSQTPTVKPKLKRRSVYDIPGVITLSNEKRQKLNSGPLISELFKPSNPPIVSPEPRRPQVSSVISESFPPTFSRQGPPPQPHTPTFDASAPGFKSPPPKPRKPRKPRKSTSVASTPPGAQKSPIENPVPPARTPPIQVSPDELPQPIVKSYSEYKWSVYHYSVLPFSGYDHAERWVQALFDQNLAADYQARHVAHVTQGFIQDGGAHSIIVLYNAANPFEYEPVPDATTTIGVYGLYWHKHAEIHWTTLATDLRWLFLASVQAGFIKLDQHWTFDDPKASEKRFHRAYWLAANRRGLGGLLNRMPSTDKQPYLIEDLSEEDPDKDFCITEEDMTNEWDVTAEQSELAWQQVEEFVELLGKDFDPSGRNYQHLVVSNTEDF